MNVKKIIKKYENLHRDQYFNKNKELGEKLWSCSIPTVGDIANFLNGEENENINNVFKFFNNKEDFLKMINNTCHFYNQDESSNFIKKVMSANNDDISKAGYFYKLLMASADDLTITEKDCKSNGVNLNVNEIKEEDYNYYIKYMYLDQYDDYMKFNYLEFLEWLNDEGITQINVQTPLSCEIRKNRCLCEKCSGLLPDNLKNIGNFTALMITESSTQSALSSMNNGIQENINEILSSRYYGKYNWLDIENWIIELTNRLKNTSVSSRFYQIALLSRIRLDSNNKLPFVSSFKASISRSENLFGSYIFTPNYKEFEKIIRRKEFDDNSLKLKIAINNFDI